MLVLLVVAPCFKNHWNNWAGKSQYRASRMYNGKLDCVYVTDDPECHGFIVNLINMCWAPVTCWALAQGPPSESP